MMRGPFNLDGTRRREQDKPCKLCGAMVECDECWEYTSDWSPFVIIPCFICRMPITACDGGLAEMRCDFCGADEAEFATSLRIDLK
jgi:hypothetical protein